MSLNKNVMISQELLAQYPIVASTWLEAALQKKDKVAFEIALSTFLESSEMIRKPPHSSGANSFMNGLAQATVFKCFPGHFYGQRYVANPLNNTAPAPYVVGTYGDLQTAVARIMELTAESKGLSFPAALLYRLIQEDSLGESFWQKQSPVTLKLVSLIDSHQKEWMETLKTAAYRKSRLQLVTDLQGPEKNIVVAEHQLSNYLNTAPDPNPENEAENVEKVKDLLTFLKQHPEHLKGDSKLSMSLNDLRQPLTWQCSDEMLSIALKEMVKGNFGTYLDHRSKQDFLMLGCKLIELQHVKSFSVFLDLLEARKIHVDEPIGAKGHLRHMYNWYECDLHNRNLATQSNSYLRHRTDARSLMEKALFNHQEWAKEALLAHGAGWNRRLYKNLRDFAEKKAATPTEKENHQHIVGILKARFEQWQIMAATSPSMQNKPAATRVKPRRI